jgi:hypothetical protein
MNSENIQSSTKIEELCIQIVADLEDTYSGLFLRGVTDPEVIKKGDIAEIGKSLQRISEFFDNRLEDLEFPPQKEEIDKTLFRLKRTNKVIWENGKRN